MRPLLSLLLAFVLLLAAIPAAAAVRLHAPAAVTVREGERIELRWEGLDSGVREVEFELSLDGGRWVRISPELEALEGRWTWLVPEIDAAEARIRLRCGGHRREEAVAVGGAFRIAGGHALRGEGSLGEWWPALDRDVHQGTPIGLHTSDAPVFAPLAQARYADVPVALVLAAPVCTARLLGSSSTTAPQELSHARSARPAFVPLRN